MTEQITVPRATWDALREALKHGIREMNMSGKAKECMPLHHAITAANAVNDMQNCTTDCDKLRDPAVLHANLLRGFPALLTPEQLWHLIGEVQQKALIAKLGEPQAQGEAITLQRWGRAENLCLRLLDPMDDGYWTPWHIAQEAIDSLQKKIAFHPQATEPAGYKLVPVEPTPEMIAAAEQVEDLYRRGTPDTWCSVYRAMLAAAPEAKQ